MRVTGTMTFAISATVYYVVTVIGEKLGDRPMPDDMKILGLAVLSAAWIVAFAVRDLSRAIRG